MLRTKLLATVAVALAATIGSAEAQDRPRIVVVTHGTALSAFWSVVKNAVDDAAAELPADVEYLAPETFDMVSMAQLIRSAVASQPDGIAVSVPDVDALGGPIRDAIAAGIPVVTLNSGQEYSKELGAIMHVGQSEFEAGQGAGRRMAEAGVTNAVCVNHEVGNVALDVRCEGFADGLGQPVEVVAVTPDPTEEKNTVGAYLASHPDLQGLLVLGVDAAIPTLTAVEDAGRDVQLATFDLSEEVLNAIADGRMDFAIDQQQYLQGYLPVVVLILYDRYGLLPGADILTGPGFVTPDNAKNVLEWSAAGYR